MREKAREKNMTEHTKKTRQDDVAGRFANEETLLVYGTGRNARIFCDRMKNSACQLVFFDRRAEAEVFFFYGKKVFPPREMLNYPGVPVLVTPYAFQEDITRQMTGMGIEKSRIYRFQQVPEELTGISMLTFADDPEDADRVGKPIVFSRDLLSKARGSITDDDPTDYPVLSSDGRTLFYLHMTSKIALRGYCSDSTVVTPNYYCGGKLINELAQLDLTLLSSYDGYVVDELEEYTFALTELILSLWPERPVWYRDPRAAMFWGDDQVRILPENDDTELPPGRNLMNILTRRTYLFRIGKRAEQRHFFDSIQIMASLCWARKGCKLGEKNPDKTIFVIEISTLSAGMGDLVKIVQAYAGAARERGWTPVAWLHDTQYSDELEKDLWSEWFTPLSEVPLEDALHSARVILGGENGTSITSGAMAFAWNPYLEYHMGWPTLRLSNKLLRRFEQSSGVKPGENLLGVVIRGSDYLSYVYPDSSMDLDKLIEQVSSIRTEGHFSKVFLATEEEESLEAFRTAFGEDLLFVDQKRIRGYKDGDPLIWERLLPPMGERMAWGEKYLYILWRLSCCEALVYNLNSGAVDIARRLKEGRGEQYRFMRELSIEGI